MPKFNLYQSLHTTVIGPGGKPVELQIRTWSMHKRAEYRTAARCEVRGGRGERGPRPADGRVEEAPHQDGRRDRRDGLAAPAGRLAARDRGADGVPGLPPFRPGRPGGLRLHPAWRGDRALPHNATPVDFAYAIHTDVGHHTIGARVNGRLVSLESTLDNGETVEIFTSKSQEASPNQDWLTSSSPPAPATRSASGSPRNGARRRSRRARTRSPRSCARMTRPRPPRLHRRSR